MEAKTAEFLSDQALSAAGTIQSNLQIYNVALPPGWTIADQEKAAPNRRRFRGTFKTTRLASWLSYVADSLKSLKTYGLKMDQPQAFISPRNMEAVAIFDIGTHEVPGHCEWRATFDAKVTADYLALISVTDRGAVDQQTLVDFFSDWAPNLVFADKSHTAALLISAVRKVQVSKERRVDAEVHNLASSGSVMDSVAARSTAGELPDSFGFTMQPYEGFQQRTIGVQLRLAPGSDRPLFYLRIDQKDALVESIENEFVSIIETGLAEALPIYLGSFA